MRFPGSKPSACEVVEALFNEFTPEERRVLNGESCVFPNMYSLLLEEAESLKSNYSLEEAKRRMKNLFFPLGERVNDPRIQENIFCFFTDILFCQ